MFPPGRQGNPQAPCSAAPPPSGPSDLGITPLGILPFDPAVQEAEEAGTPVFDLPGAESTRAGIGAIATALEEQLGPFGWQGGGRVH